MESNPVDQMRIYILHILRISSGRRLVSVIARIRCGATKMSALEEVGAILCNSLPINVRQAESLGQFKDVIERVLYSGHGKQLFIFFIFPLCIYSL